MKKEQEDGIKANLCAALESYNRHMNAKKYVEAQKSAFSIKLLGMQIESEAFNALHEKEIQK